MRTRIFSMLLVFALFALGGGAQSPSDRPVWTMEFVKVKSGMFGLTLGYLDDNWMRVRDVAKHQGAVLSFSRIAEKGNRESDGTIVLLTEYKNQAACDAREALFDSIRKQLPNNTSGVVRPARQEDLYETISTRVLQDYSEMSTEGRFRRLAAD
jgi:hypothetical protein